MESLESLVQMGPVVAVVVLVVVVIAVATLALTTQVVLVVEALLEAAVVTADYLAPAVVHLSEFSYTALLVLHFQYCSITRSPLVWWKWWRWR